LTHFTPGTLKDLLVGCGFEMVEVQQNSRAGWLGKAMARIHQRGKTRSLDYWLRYGVVRRWMARKAGWEGRGNELVARGKKMNPHPNPPPEYRERG
jgi:hypothetical protein